MNKWTARAALPVILFCTALGGVRTLEAQQQEQASTLKLNALEIELNGRVQTQFNTTTVEGEAPGEWIMRRVRLEAKVRLNDLVSGKIQPDFAGDRLSLKDAFVRFDFAPALQLQAGKMHRPFSLLEQTSSTRILPIERGGRIRGVQTLDEYELVNSLRYSDRDIGLQLSGAPEGAPLGLAYAVGLFGGPLQGRVGAEGTSQVAARVTVDPVEQLRLGAGWSSRDFAPAEGAGFGLRRGHAFTADVEYGAFAPGLHLLAEVVTGDADPFRDREFRGAQAWLGYRTGALGALTGVEPILRVSHGDLYGGAVGGPEGGTLLTPGLNLYFGPLNRIMVNYDVWSPAADAERQEGSLKVQFQMAF